jgi:hypothetical protein
MENIAGYLLDHTTRNESRWRRADDAKRGPYLVSAIHGPRKDVFLRLIRLQTQSSSGCNPLDRRAHGLDEIARWIGNRALAIRFIGLGVILGAFELATPWEAVLGEDLESMDRRLAVRGAVRFRLKGSRPWTAVLGSANQTTSQQSRRRPGPRRARYTRRKPARGYGLTAPA